MPKSEEINALPYKKPDRAIKIAIIGPNNTGRSGLARFIQEAIQNEGVTAYVTDDDGARPPVARVPQHTPIDIEVITLRTAMVNVNDIQDQVLSLSNSLAILGVQKRTAEQSRDRVLTENCALSQKNRDLAALCRAWVRFEKARSAFVTNPYPTDAETQEGAEAECELEKLIEQHAHLYQR